MRASLYGLLLLALGGCQPQGSVVKITVSSTPIIDGIGLVTVDTTVNGQLKKNSLHPAPAQKTPFTFAQAFPSSVAGKMANVTVNLWDTEMMGTQLGTAIGSVMVPSGGQTGDLMLTVGGGDSKCGTMQTIGPLCDGFENSYMNFWNAPVVQNAMDRPSQVEIVQTMARRGKASLHVSTGAIAPGDMGGLVIATLNETSYLPDNVFIRMFVYVPAAFNTNIAGAIMIVENSTTFKQLEVSIENQALNVFDSIDGMKYPAMGMLTYDTWHCVELEVQKGNPGAINLWLDDAVALSKGGIATNGDFNMLAVGLTDTLPNSPDRELWIDEVAVDSKRIFCAN